MEVFLQIFYSVFSGLLLSLAIPNEFALLGIPSLTLIALIPLYSAFSRCRNYRESFTVFFIQAITTHLASSFWLAYFKDFAILTLGASAVGTGFIGGFFGLFMFLPFICQSNKYTLANESFFLPVFHTKGFRVLYFAALYTTYEWVKSIGFLGYPWGTLTSGIFKWPVLMQLSAITGTYGITFLLCCINGLFSEGFIYICDFFSENKPHRNELHFESIKNMANTTAIFLILTLIYGIVKYNQNCNPQKKLSAIIVQQNSDPWKQTSDEETIMISQKNTKKEIENLNEQGITPDIVVWSEGTLSHFFPDSYDFYKYYPIETPLIPFIREIKTPLLVGGAYIGNKEEQRFYNAALLFDSNGDLRGYYPKNHLVPFAEVIPGLKIPKVGEIIKKIIGISAGWTPGDQYTYFEIPGTFLDGYRLPMTKDIDISKSFSLQKMEEQKRPLVKISTPICFDDAFTDVMRPLWKYGTEVFLNITDDSWSLTKSSEYQHFVIASYRAIEYRTTLVRATNAGVSAVITPSGRVIASMPLFEACSLAVEIPVYNRTTTTYALLGNYIPWTLFILLMFYGIYSFLTFSKDDYIPSERKKDLSKKSKHKKHHKK